MNQLQSHEHAPNSLKYSAMWLDEVPAKHHLSKADAYIYTIGQWGHSPNSGPKKYLLFLSYLLFFV